MLIYEPIMKVLVALVIRAGNARCPGHGTYEYMVGRVLADLANRINPQQQY